MYGFGIKNLCQIKTCQILERDSTKKSEV